MTWSSTFVSARVVIGEKEFECVRAAVSFELNAIPRAMFLVAVGRGHHDLIPAAVHTSTFETQDKVQFYVQLDHIEGAVQNLPTGEFLLFEGYLTGVTFQKSRELDHAVLHARHWLLDMDYSSALSDTSHPMNPSQFTYKALHQFQGAGGSASWTPFLHQGLITPAVLGQDFWAEGLLKWLQDLTQENLINNAELTMLGAGGGSNDTAASALNRFTTSAGNYVPLAMNFNGADSAAVADAIWNDVQMETFESFANVTLWGKLISEFASRYMFAVVPRVQDALVIPYVPGLRKSWSYELSTKDYIFLSASSELTRLLRGVGIFSGLKSRTGAGLREPGGDSTRLGLGGWFSPDSVSSGMVMLKQGPRWLTNMIATDRYSEFSTGKGGTQIIGTALHPGVGSNASGVAEPAQLQASSKALLDAFAQALYVFENLRLRQMEISGKIRFDIAPGSTVKLDTAGDKFIPNNTQQRTLYCDVLRVTYLFDSEASRAGTDFHLAHTRTEKENTQDGFSLDSNPLWKNPWPGAGLLEMYDNG